MSGRIRTIKPEILENKRTASLSSEAWRLFVSCITLADDYGNLIAEPERLKGIVFWAAPPKAQVNDLLGELIRAELIDLYTVRQCRYAHVIGWTEHQKIDHPGKNKVPKPDEAEDPQSDVDSMASNVSRESREGLAKSSPWIGREGKGKEGKGVLPDQGSGTDAFDFEALYASYPRKLGRKKGMQRCKTQITTREKYDALVRAVGNYAAYVARERKEIDFVMYFSSFMNCWEDYVDPLPFASTARAKTSGWARPATAEELGEPRDATDEL